MDIIIDILLKIAAFFIDRNAESKKSQDLYIKFVRTVNQTYGESARLRTDYLDQIDRLERELDK